MGFLAGLIIGGLIGVFLTWLWGFAHDAEWERAIYHQAREDFKARALSRDYGGEDV